MDGLVGRSRYDNGTLKRGDKSDYIWKTEQALGVKDFPSIFHTNLAKRFPTFAKLLSVNSTTEGWASAANSTFTHNVFLNNSVCHLPRTVARVIPARPFRARTSL